MGNDKFISFQGKPRVVGDWTEQAIMDVAHASAVALTVKPDGIFGYEGEAAYVIGIAFTCSLRGGDLIGWLHEHLRSGRVWFHDLDWPDHRAWVNNNDGRGWRPDRD